MHFADHLQAVVYDIRDIVIYLIVRNNTWFFISFFFIYFLFFIYSRFVEGVATISNSFADGVTNQIFVLSFRISFFIAIN